MLSDDNQSRVSTHETDLLDVNNDKCGTFRSVESFCTSYGGTLPIKRVLIANNGNAAMKAIKSLRAWSLKTFGNDLEIEIVGMATPDDELSNAEYISRLDYLAKVPQGTNNHNFANVKLIQEIAERWDCDAVWPGWGHASEDSRVPRALAETSKPVRWIGPSPDAMDAVGCKIGSTIIAQSVNVPVVPWSGSKLRVTPGTDGTMIVSDSMKDSACVRNAASLLAMVDSKELEFPLMIKAAAGGGGKGIRVVSRREEVEDAYRQVVNEVKGSLVFAMKLLTKCRHLEVQILADQCGNVIHLGSRDCTIQRRHQKIIEEGPAIVAAPDIVEAMCNSAVRLCAAVGYSNAATVEFLYDLETSKYYFLEVNARLQVEHVVTEMLTDVNLPAAQLCICMGIPLKNIPDLAAYCKRREAGLLEEEHCIAARITAEDAEKGFQPTSGTVHDLSFESSPHVWGYFSIVFYLAGSNSRIHQYADSQFGHIFSTSRTRDAARVNLILSLKSLIVRGEISTNVHALQKVLESPEFISNETFTTWVEKGVHFTSPPPARQVAGTSVLSALTFAAVFKASRYFTQESENFLSRVNQGQIPPTLSSSHEIEFVYRDSTKFRIECQLKGPNELRLTMNGSHVDLTFIPLPNETESGWYFINGGLDGRHRRVCFREDTRQDTLRVTVNNTTYTFSQEKDPTQIRAPFSGKLVRWIVEDGGIIAKGQPYAEIELMKMYIQLTAADAGIISHSLSEGAIFTGGDLLATLDLPEGQVVVRPQLFEGTFPPQSSGMRKGMKS